MVGKHARAGLVEPVEVEPSDPILIQHRAGSPRVSLIRWTQILRGERGVSESGREKGYNYLVYRALGCLE